jgi:hypothetical protein
VPKDLANDVIEMTNKRKEIHEKYNMISKEIKDSSEQKGYRYLLC